MTFSRKTLILNSEEHIEAMGLGSDNTHLETHALRKQPTPLILLV